MKVLCVFGTRPEAIKMAPVVTELKEHAGFDCKVCVSAQHRAMLDDVLELFDITPDYDLDVMKEDQSPGQVTARVLAQLQGVLQTERPRWTLVQGDTVTTMAAAMASFFERISIGHVEAGLRTGDKWQPFPEEITRRATALVTDLHFAPTERARENLLREGVAAADALVTGNTVIDALLDITSRPYDERGTVLEGILNTGRRLITLTSHRRESFGEPLLNTCRAVAHIAQAYRDDVHIVYPVHPNPNVIGPVTEHLGGIPNVSLIEPLDYKTLAHLMKHSYLILTDSGGIQEEAPSLKVPVLVLREVTERPEAVEAGVARLVGTDPDLIVSVAERLLDDPEAHAAMTTDKNPYGDGLARKRIAAALEERR